jgi:hypothetical protein
MKIAGHIPWREQLDLNEVEASCDEYGWDEMFEAIEDGGGASVAVGIRRTPVAPGNFQRHSTAVIATNWDEEFSSAQAHARDVLAKLG